MIEQSLAIIREALATAKAPVVAWSSGKDSQVILWLVRQVKPNIEVVFFRNADDPERFRFADEYLIREGIRAHFPQSQWQDVVAKGDEIEILTFRNLAPGSPLMCGIGEDKSQPPKRCGLPVLTQQNAQSDMHFDVVFMGHRSDDVCPIQGAIPLSDYRAPLANCTLVYPIKDWTEQDVWACIEAQQIPLDPRRYDVAGRKEWDDKRFNPDYDAICVNCLKPSLGAVVPCFLDGETESIAHIINPEQRAKDYRRRIANLSN